MEVVYPHCAGMDVHKETVVVCIRHRQPDGVCRTEVRTFGTTTGALERLGDWLEREGIEIAAMESTGVYWKPIWNLLEDRLQLMLVNAQHVKQVPGRKTDVKDCQWLAELLEHGLLKASFVPETELRVLRDLTRGRTVLVADKTRVVNRIQKVLEDANIKLASVASDVMGQSGRAMIKALIAGQSDPAAMAQLAKSRLGSKKAQLQEALHGHVTEHHRFMLNMSMSQVEYLDRQIETLEARMEQVMSPFVKAAVDRIDPVPGINRQGGIALIAEIGPDMTRFATGDHLASWAGMCPGNNQSGGKRRNGRLKPGNRWLKALLDQIAWAASKKKDSWFKARYHRLMKRRGKKRAAMAVGRSILIAVHAMLTKDCEFKDLGSDYFHKHQGARIKNNLVHKLEQLGYKVTLTAAA
jgi:transposase